MKKLLISLPVVAALLLGACSETSVEKVNGSDKKTEAKKEEKKDEVYKIGDTVKINNVEYTIQSAKLSNGQEFLEPENGKVLTLEIKATNKSDAKVFVSSSEFNLSKKDEQQKEYFGNKEHINADLNKGKKVSGIIQYDVTKGPGTYELIYTPSFSIDNKEVKWKIDVK